MPMFSIIMPCFNAAETIEETIASLIGQKDTDWELICVDDGSSDRTREKIGALMRLEPRIRLLPSDGKGPSHARNTGAARANGQIICFCDADDLWVTEKLSQLRAVFSDPAVDGVFGRIAFFSRVGQASAQSTVPSTPLTIEMLLGENPVCTMSNMSLRRGAFVASGGFDTRMVHNEDLDWLIRLVGHGACIVGVNQLQVWYRTAVGGLSADLCAMERSRQQAIASAKTFGHQPTRRNEAIYLRYLARRALRLNKTGFSALRLAVQGITQSPKGFLIPPKRGLTIVVAAMVAPFLPKPLRVALFAR
jgi:glycosyltransferase involved in cell wall biosynthesis